VLRMAAFGTLPVAPEVSEVVRLIKCHGSHSKQGQLSDPCYVNIEERLDC
jgi:hypothetical protein